ncbi:MAG: adenylosuccinate lyase [Cytophagales bacterium]|nr:adenylosuccinate lyase [Cytophagales bacterium]MDW8383680.1 adenylosuccinate lyase [Flammeovirgaceae bacterium]
MSTLSTLTAISPIDGRYYDKTYLLSKYFSEYALIRYRVMVEIEYFISLAEVPLPQLQNIPSSSLAQLRNIYKQFEEKNAITIKNLEKITNHDVKAVEYFIKQEFSKIGIGNEIEFVHFGLTSQDINNTSIPIMLRDATQEVLLPSIQEIVSQLNEFALRWANIPMLAHTHGQPASPTRVGKELKVFAYRLEEQIKMLLAVPYAAKFGGATGNFNAHQVAYPHINWIEFANKFIEQRLQLKRSRYTTQIENYDYLAAYCDAWKRINTILIDLCRDIWQYISMNYFKQKINPQEVGSSAMPHKVNPIDFENAEGNLGIANALLEHFAAKLPISRLQRDLTDSTVLRNLGVPLAHILVAADAIQKGFEKIELNMPSIQQDLEQNWVVIAEGIQTILRREGFPKPYEALKELTRTTQTITKEDFKRFIENLEVSAKVKDELLKISPFNYIGIYE